MSIYLIILFFHHSNWNRIVLSTSGTRWYGFGSYLRQIRCTVASTRLQRRHGWNRYHLVVHLLGVLFGWEYPWSIWCTGCGHVGYWNQPTSNQYQSWSWSLLTQVCLILQSRYFSKLQYIKRGMWTAVKILIKNTVFSTIKMKLSKTKSR